MDVLSLVVRVHAERFVRFRGRVCERAGAEVIGSLSLAGKALNLVINLERCLHPDEEQL